MTQGFLVVSGVSSPTVSEGALCSQYGFAAYERMLGGLVLEMRRAAYDHPLHADLVSAKADVILEGIVERRVSRGRRVTDMAATRVDGGAL